MSEKLSMTELHDLKKLKEIVISAEKSYRQSQLDGGAALIQINERKLYRGECDTFEEFCVKNFKIKKSHAYRLMEGAKIKKVSPIGDKLLTESQIRSLKGVPVTDHSEIAEIAEEAGGLTPKNLAAAAVSVAAKKPAGTVNPTPPVVKDEKGREIPQAIMLIWNRRPEVRQLMDAISEVKCHIKEALERGDVLYAEIDNGLVADLETAYATIKCALPYTVCPSCQGRDFKNCLLCGKRGFISKYKYDTAVTTEIKKQVDAAIAAKAKK